MEKQVKAQDIFTYLVFAVVDHSEEGKAMTGHRLILSASQHNAIEEIIAESIVIMRKEPSFDMIADGDYYNIEPYETEDGFMDTTVTINNPKENNKTGE